MAALATAGLKLFYVVEGTAGTRPTTGLTEIPEIVSTPAFDSAPEQIEVTTLSETSAKQYVPGLKDLSGANAYTANLTDAFITAWEAFVTACNAAKAAGKATWIYLVHPYLTKAVGFTGEPSELGLPAAAVNSALTANAYITVTGNCGFVAKPTLPE